MDDRPLYAADHDLVDAARETLESRFDPDRHRVASALRTEDGTVYTAVNLRSTVDEATVHCEPITLEKALADGHGSLDASVAVAYPAHDPAKSPRVISACGVCRELLVDYDPTLDVIVRLDGDLRKASVADLLPARV